MSRKEISAGEELLKKIKAEQDKRASIHLRSQRDREPNLLQISEALDEYYFLEKLRTYCNYLSYRVIVNDAVIGYSEEDLRLIPAILEEMQRRTSWPPAVLIYYQISLLFHTLSTDPPDSSEGRMFFTTVELLIDRFLPELSDVDLIEMHSHLTNYSTYQINTGHEEYLLKNIMHNQRLIDLFDEQSDDQFVINAGVYKNMVTLILKTVHSDDPALAGWLTQHQHADIFAWAHHFADKYKDNLPEIGREKYYGYCKALVYFRSGAIREAFNLIKGLERIRELFINFDIKVLRLQLLLELDLIDDRILEREQVVMEDEIEGLRSMLKYDKHNNPKLAYQSTYFWEFLNLFRKFYSFYNKYAWMFRFGDAEYHEKREQLKQAMLSCSFPYRGWFLDKLEAIK